VVARAFTLAPRATWSWSGKLRGAATTGGARTRFDEEQHVQALQPDSIDGKEINRDHARRLRAQELAPRRAPSLPRRPELLLVGELKGLGVERKSSAVVS
jgi:hypothetical protein